nr:hypothetical protein [Priestia megaterium]MDH3168909.1 hypothetical protein [Priestia megaterium]
MSLSINELVRGKRIFKQETDRDYKYLTLDADKIRKCIYFDYVIAIKPGDLPYPKKWWLRYFSTKPVKGQIVPVEEYKKGDYEYIFMPEFGLRDELKRELEELGYDTDDSNKGESFLSQLDEIPAKLLPTVKNIVELNQKDTTRPITIIDCYMYEEQGEPVYFIVEDDLDVSTISEELTIKFQNMVTHEVYETPTKDKYLYKAKDTTDRYKSESWYLYSDNDANFPYFEELFNLEDLIPYTAFKEIQLK